MKKDKKRIYFITIFIILCVLAFIIVLIQLIKVNNECIKNPFTYAANTIINKRGEIAYSLCSCNVKIVNSYDNGKFYFDRNGVYRYNPFINGTRGSP